LKSRRQEEPADGEAKEEQRQAHVDQAGGFPFQPSLLQQCLETVLQLKFLHDFQDKFACCLVVFRQERGALRSLFGPCRPVGAEQAVLDFVGIGSLESVGENPPSADDHSPNHQ